MTGVQTCALPIWIAGSVQSFIGFSGRFIRFVASIIDLSGGNRYDLSRMEEIVIGGLSLCFAFEPGAVVQQDAAAVAADQAGVFETAQGAPDHVAYGAQ